MQSCAAEAVSGIFVSIIIKNSINLHRNDRVVSGELLSCGDNDAVHGAEYEPIV